MTKENFERAAWQTPDVEFRPIPFWGWNEKLEPEELKRQIREMRSHGFGGFFIHARAGLKIEYLGEEWFKHVELCAAEAKRLGMQAWLYDEDCWPSGYAGGKTAEATGPDYSSYALVCREDAGKKEFKVIRSPKNARNALAHPWNSGSGDPDVLNPEVTAAFLKVTHEKYRRRVGKYFAKTVPGVFTDEPSYVMWSHDAPFNSVPWTGKMEEIFLKRRGYALKPHLKSLFSDVGDFRKVRVDFYRTVTELFRDGYAKMLFDWCERQGLVSTGHMMMEDSLLSQTQSIGAAMPHYEFFQIPGIDGLGWRLTDSPLLAKQCAGAARQLGRNRVVAELFGGAGWETPIGKLRPKGDYFFALGVNLLNQHITYYSLRGCRKRDWPNSCSYHQPGYDLYRPFNDYFSRLSYALTRGRPVCRILVLHPIASAWAAYTPGNHERVKELDRQFAELSRNLLRCQRDYDYGDELLMEKYARAVNGKLTVGRMSYDAVIVPPAGTWSSSTFALLKKFAGQGGKIIAAGKQAAFLDGRPSEELSGFLSGPAVLRIKEATPEALKKALAFLPPDVSVRDEGGKPVPELVYQHRTDGLRELYFLTFGNRQKEFRASVALEGEGAVDLLNPETGAIESLPARTGKGMMKFEVNIPAQGSCLVMLTRGEMRREKEVIEARPTVKPLDGPWKVTRQGPNVLLIDRCRLKYNDNFVTEPMGIAGGGRGAAPVSLPNANDVLLHAYEKKDLWPEWPVDLQLEFQADLNPEGIDPWLVIENAAAFTAITANGKAVRVDESAWWLDRQFRKASLAGALRKGLNRIDYRVKWASPMLTDGVELDNAYILGNFNVKWQGASTRIASAKEMPADPGADLAKHGLPFYVGVIRYEKEFVLPEVYGHARYAIRFPCPNGEGLRLTVNGKPAGLLWHEPFTADCASLLRPGKNHLQVDLFTNLGNVLGLVHHRPPMTDPAHFIRPYQLRPVGLGGTPELIINLR